MPDGKWKVIQCPMDELESELNQLPDGYAPVLFHLSQDIPASHVTVVLGRVAPQAPPIAIPIAALSRRN